MVKEDSVQVEKDLCREGLQQMLNMSQEKSKQEKSKKSISNEQEECKANPIINHSSNWDIRDIWITS